MFDNPSIILQQSKVGAMPGEGQSYAANKLAEYRNARWFVKDTIWDSGVYFIHKDMQAHKHKVMLVIAERYLTDGFSVIVLTNPLADLREQGIQEINDLASEEVYYHPPIEIGPGMPSQQIANWLRFGMPRLRPGMLLYGIAHPPTLAAINEALQKNPELRKRYVVISDEHDVNPHDVPSEYSILAEKGMKGLVDGAFATVCLSGTLLPSLIQHTKAGQFDPEKVLILHDNDDSYQGLEDFIPHFINESKAKPGKKYIAANDSELTGLFLPTVVKQVKQGESPFVAMVHLHRKTGTHDDIERVIQNELNKNYPHMVANGAIVVKTINGNGGKGKNREKPCDFIARAVKGGAKCVIIVGGKMLERGIRIASADVFSDGANLTHMYMIPPSRNPALPTMLQVIGRMHGSYPKKRERHIFTPKQWYEESIKYRASLLETLLGIKTCGFITEEAVNFVRKQFVGLPQIKRHEKAYEHGSVKKTKFLQIPVFKNMQGISTDSVLQHMFDHLQKVYGPLLSTKANLLGGLPENAEIWSIVDNDVMSHIERDYKKLFPLLEEAPHLLRPRKSREENKKAYHDGLPFYNIVDDDPDCGAVALRQVDANDVIGPAARLMSFSDALRLAAQAGGRSLDAVSDARRESEDENNYSAFALQPQLFLHKTENGWKIDGIILRLE